MMLPEKLFVNEYKRFNNAMCNLESKIPGVFLTSVKLTKSSSQTLGI